MGMKEKIKTEITNIAGLIMLPVLAVVLILIMPILLIAVYINCTKENKNARNNN